MLNWVWAGMMAVSCALALATGGAAGVMEGMLHAAREAVQTALSLAGGFAFFCGLIAILRECGMVDALSRWLAPALTRLLGKDLREDALSPVTMNLAANMLGLGNAATPMGLEAMRRMADGTARAGNAMCLFLVINASSVQLVPTTVLSLRAAAGSFDPGAVIVPSFVASLASTVVGVLACKLLQRFS